MATPTNPTESGPRLTGLGRFIIIIFIAACAAGAYQFLVRGRPAPEPGNTPATTTPAASGDRVTLGIAYGTEKQRWLEWAVREFANAPEGRGIQVDLIPLGSIEAAHAILDGDKRISVWSPASAAYEDVLSTANRSCGRGRAHRSGSSSRDRTTRSRVPSR